ncbi:MAG: 50S ribosomal protein L22 [bacterium]
MEAKAIKKYIRISSKKARRVVDLIDSIKDIEKALDILKFVPNKPARFIADTIKSASANADVKQLDKKKVFLKKVTIDEGPILKPLRWRSAPRGRATKIRKRTSHITVVISDEREVSE